MRSATLLLAAFSLLPAVGCDGRPAAREAEAPAPPLGLEFEPPAPGTYDLPPIQPAADGEVVTADGRRGRLFDFLGDRYVLLSFIYTRCKMGRGCPFATATFQMIRSRLREEPELAEQVRFVTLSFDPARDTPQAMQRYARAATADQQPEDRRDRSWVFLTTDSPEQLRPLLEAYGQYVVPETDASGHASGDFSHVLKVFLIDRQRQVRNIYSTGFLHPVVAINDLETLILEEAARAPTPDPEGPHDERSR